MKFSKLHPILFKTEIVLLCLFYAVAFFLVIETKFIPVSLIMFTPGGYGYPLASIFTIIFLGIPLVLVLFVNAIISFFDSEEEIIESVDEDSG